jgi:hypothetical protein
MPHLGSSKLQPEPYKTTRWAKIPTKGDTPRVCARIRLFLKKSFHLSLPQRGARRSMKHKPRRENGKGCNAVFYHWFHGLKRISRIICAWSIKSQAHATGVCHDIHHSFNIREIRGFYFPIQDDILTGATFTPRSGSRITSMSQEEWSRTNNPAPTGTFGEISLPLKSKY